MEAPEAVAATALGFNVAPKRPAGAAAPDGLGPVVPVSTSFDGFMFQGAPTLVSTEDRLHGHPRRRPDPGFVRLTSDAGALVLSMAVAAWAQAAAHRAAGDASVFSGAVTRLAVCLPVFVAVLGGSRHRLAVRMQTTVAQQVREVAAPIGASALACLGVWRALASLSAVGKPPEDGLLLTGLLGTVLVAVARTTALGAPGMRTRRVLLVGSGQVADRVAERLEAHTRVEVVGFVDDDPRDPAGRLGSLADLAAVCERHGVDHVVVAFSRVPAEQMVEALRAVQGRLPISVVPRLFDVLPDHADTHDLASGYPALSVGPSALGLWHRWIKRAMDMVGAALGMLVAGPVMAVAALGVRCTSRGPVFVRQVRVGLRGREFTVWKLRTFTVTESVPPPEVLAHGEHVAGPFPKLKSDPRTTRFGRVLRRTSLDELPQLLNVITGSMSLVGPRPLQPEFAWDFGSWALRRYDVKPGLTGLWQVSGRNDLTYEEMCRLDSLYVTCWSPGLDLRVLARTARAVVSGRGCY